MFAVKGESLADYWDYTHRIFDFAGKGLAGEGPNMILDDGGDATLLMHLGVVQAGPLPLLSGSVPYERALASAGALFIFGCELCNMGHFVLSM